MSFLPSGNIFRELQVVHDTGYFSAQPSLEDRWQQVRPINFYTGQGRLMGWGLMEINVYSPHVRLSYEYFLLLG